MMVDVPPARIVVGEKFFWMLMRPTPRPAVLDAGPGVPDWTVVTPLEVLL
ncbi:MAG: hypothetical protein IPJ28_18450 [Betaproteobacteria bacterium]|nr:hypothetical protein [Betaproteobacteria bacterium]